MVVGFALAIGVRVETILVFTAPGDFARLTCNVVSILGQEAWVHGYLAVKVFTFSGLFPLAFAPEIKACARCRRTGIPQERDIVPVPDHCGEKMYKNP